MRKRFDIKDHTRFDVAHLNSVPSQFLRELHQLTIEENCWMQVVTAPTPIEHSTYDSLAALMTSLSERIYSEASFILVILARPVLILKPAGKLSDEVKRTVKKVELIRNDRFYKSPSRQD